MKKKPFFSVIIPCYNEEKNVVPCVKSILKQSFMDFELIFVNDGSADNTAKILRNFKDKRIILVDNKQNKGRPASVNDGIYASKGQIVVITDADCIAPRNWLQNIKQEFDKNPQLDAVGGVYESIGQDAISLAGNLLERIFMDFGLIPNALPGANSAYKRETLIELGGYPLRKWGADSFLNMLMHENKKSIKISSKNVIKTNYPKKMKPILKRKFYWGGGLAKTVDKMKFKLGFFIRPVYFILLLSSIAFTIIFLFISKYVATFGLISTALLFFIPHITILLLSLVWIKRNKKYVYLNSLPIMLFLPVIQEFSYFLGFIYVLVGRNLKNAWR
ncbi:glycosyltransferase family 2 protein [Candidatus Woesearchaeota archaeon]|nr:glycosyltransferase family 2 protein [Candidatus Woesearchaeota archaeon]MBW3006417.1 glycosyltransferase family 2 protein [Candidatus Woesearchaeota archaeon]